MEVIRTIAELRARLAGERDVCCVPTMGNIHDGHLSLVKIAVKNAPVTVTTIFVNRLQFGQGEDFERYPRTFEEDCAKLEAVGNTIVFHPDEEQMYPEPQAFFVDPPKVAKKLEGRFRPGHFRGVCSVVLKLFNTVQPQSAVFGKKDYQQLAIIRHMVDQFALPIRIIPAETVRADDGLALASRNRYLSKEERKEAPRLREAILQIRDAINEGDRKFVAMEYAAGALLSRHGWNVDYVVVRTQRGLKRPSPDDSDLVILGAATLGSTRLIDNLEVVAP
ncbi:MAG: pantoate--beta-alanine ligase [Betaproteobacteria bacterium]|nr:MAG: pantoate--beta-alanine ligase [Betaproteobacteria bacterium]